MMYHIKMKAIVPKVLIYIKGYCPVNYKVYIHSHTERITEVYLLHALQSKG